MPDVLRITHAPPASSLRETVHNVIGSQCQDSTSAADLFLFSLSEAHCYNSDTKETLKMSNIVKITIREAVESDLDEVHRMLCDLIAFQKLPHAPMEKSVLKSDSGLTAEQKHPYFTLLVAEADDHQLAGFALYYFQYKTSKGKFVYLEDLFVKESYRGSCVGHRLMQRLAEINAQHKAFGIRLRCLHFNSAKKFYERCGAVWNGAQIGDWLEYEILGRCSRPAAGRLCTCDIVSPHHYKIISNSSHLVISSHRDNYYVHSQ